MRGCARHPASPRRGRCSDSHRACNEIRGAAEGATRMISGSVRALQEYGAIRFGDREPAGKRPSVRAASESGRSPPSAGDMSARRRPAILGVAGPELHERVASRSRAVPSGASPSPTHSRRFGSVWTSGGPRCRYPQPAPSARPSGANSPASRHAEEDAARRVRAKAARHPRPRSRRYPVAIDMQSRCRIVPPRRRYGIGFRFRGHGLGSQLALSGRRRPILRYA